VWRLESLTGQELAFLVLGLLVGATAGVLVASVLRDRPRRPREVRVTVAPDSIPRRRPATLTDNSLGGATAPATGGPAEESPSAGPPGAVSAPSRTPVRTKPSPFVAAGSTIRAGEAASPASAAAPDRLVPVPVGGGVDPLMDALRAPVSRVGTTLLDRKVAADAARAAARPIPAVLQPVAAQSRPSAAGASGPSDSAESSARDTEPPGASGSTVREGPCAELRMVADERCEVATRARVEAERASDTLRAAQRSYDDHLSRAEEAARAADPRTIREAKDVAQRTFRAARGAAGSGEAVDTAARDWLLEINRINQEARSAAAAVQREQEAARALAGSLDRLTVEADAARIAASTADEACLAARQAAADCEEAEQPATSTMPPIPSSAPPAPWLDDSLAPNDATATALASGTAPTIFRLLQGDRESLVAVVERLAGDDPEQRRQWQLAISDLVDAILATAIEGAALEFPEDHPFWGPFTLTQARDIVGALASLGYRYDGLGGWQDGRFPSQRDLSLALGYAGLDPMRMRHWPNEAEMAVLFESVRVAAPEFLAVAAGDLTLGELVTMLGHRADGLAEVWNAWGRIRPLLLEER